MRKLDRKGQILIVLLLALSIISLLLLIIARNVRRDTLEQIQADQYERYYTAIEEELLRIVNNQNPNCDLTVTDSCVIQIQSLSDPGLHVNDLIVNKKISTTFNNLEVEKDKTVLINLDGYDDDLTLSWNGDVAWVVNIDYQVADEYKTTESIYDNIDIFPNDIDTYNCIDFIPIAANPNSFSFNIGDCLYSLDSTANALSIRLRPIRFANGTTELTLSGVGPGFPAQATIITARGEISDDLINSPVIQLDLTIPLNNPKLEIMDYALRTEDPVEKSD